MKAKRCGGFTLIELMVAIVISLVGVLAATEAYLATRQTNRLQGMQSRLSEDGRFAVSMLQRFLSQAGFRVSPNTTLSADRIAVAGNVITIKFAPDGANQIDCTGAVAAANAADQTYTIQQSGTSLRCGVVNWIAPAASGAGNGTEVVDFAVRFGVDTGPAGTAEDFGCGVSAASVKPRDCITDSYVSALPGGVTSDQITAVRACLVLRSEAIDSSVVKPAAVKDCSGADIANTQIDNKLYRTFTTTVLMKNR